MLMKNQCIDKCPLCGGALIAVCSVPVKYRVENNDEGLQDWTMQEVVDDCSDVIEFSCEKCNTLYFEFEFDANGNLISLGSV